MGALTTAATLPNPLYALLEGGQYLTIAGALSRVQVDVDFYDGSTYRKVVDAAMLGNAHSTVAEQKPSQGASTADGPGVAHAGTVPIGAEAHPVVADFANAAVGNLSASISGSNQAVVLPGATTSYAPAAITDSAFRVGADDVVPGITKKTRTLFQFWSEAAGAGSLVAEVWADEVRGWASSAPTNLG